MTHPLACHRRYVDAGTAACLSAKDWPGCALFLDRDGVINIDYGYVHRQQDTRWVPGVFEICTAARNAGFMLVVVTNQAGIARGLYSEEEFLGYTRWIHEEFAARNVPLAATYYCPHHPTAGIGALKRRCDSRKPNPGMLRAAIADFGINPQRSILVGDKPSDVEAGRAQNIACCLQVSSGDLAGIEREILRFRQAVGP